MRANLTKTENTVLVRDSILSDAEFIKEAHTASGMDYRLPDLESPLFFVRKTVEDTEGNVIGACYLRLTAETYLWLDPNLSPKGKIEAMSAMQPQVLASAWSLGLDDVEARIPEDIEKKFKKRLHQLGWSKDRSGWSPWSRSTQ